MFKRTLYILFFLIFTSTSFLKINSQVIANENTFQIEENDTTIISDIYNVSVKDSNFIISDVARNLIAIYKFNGKLIKSLKPFVYLSDSLVKYGKPISKDRIMNSPNDMLDSNGKVIERSEFNKYLTNLYVNSNFLNNDEILITAQIRTLQTDTTKKEIYNAIGLNSALVKFNLRTSSFQVIPLENNDSIIAQSEVIELIDNNTLLLRCDGRKHYTSFLDSNFYTLGYYNLQGHFIKPVFKYPKEYLFPKSLFYDFPKIKIDNYNKIDMIYRYLPILFKPLTNEMIILQNISKNNLIFFNILKQGKISEKSIRDSINFYTDVYLTNIEITEKNNCLISVMQRKILGDTSTNNISYKILEYNSNYEFIKEKELMYITKNGKIHFISYSKFNESIMIFRKNNKGWNLTFEKW